VIVCRARVLCCVVALASLAVGCRSSDDTPRGFRFTPVDDGIEYARFFVAAENGAAAFDGHAFKVDLSRADLRILPAGGPSTRRDVETIVRALPRVVASNASFFAEDGRTMGLVVDQGTLRGRRRIKKWSALVVHDTRASIVEGAAIDLQTRPSLVAQGQPRLVVDGQPTSLKPQVARRTVACVTGDEDARGHSHLVLLVTSDVDASVLARTLAKSPHEGGLGCHAALNFDGGPSTQLVARLGDFGISRKGGDAVPNALAIVPGKAKTAITHDGESDSGPLDSTAIVDDQERGAPDAGAPHGFTPP
jgi:hypothetical protein